MQVEYGGWERCFRLANAEIELIATADVGPRVIRLGFIGEPSVFGEKSEDLGKTGGDTWRIYGGHRLWHAPEASPRTYIPDNAPVNVVDDGNTLALAQEVEPITGIEKTIELSLDPNENRVTVIHRLRNRGVWPVATAAWAVSVMEKGGFAVAPLAPPEPGDWGAQAFPLVLWPYTNMADSRWRLGERFITLSQDPAESGKQKMGLACRGNWVAYAVGEYLFLKTFAHQPGATYPDCGSSVEFYADAEILEVETLGPMALLQPGEALTHTERWFLYRGVNVNDDDDSIAEQVAARASKALAISDAEAPWVGQG